MKLLQLIGQKNNQSNQTFFSDPNQQQIAKMAEIISSLQQKPQETPTYVQQTVKKQIKFPLSINNFKQQTKINESTTKKPLQNVSIVNENPTQNNANPTFLNKNLYVDFLASLYKQNKMQKTQEELTLAKLFPNNNNNYMKQENSQANTNGSFSNQEESGDTDAQSNSNETLRNKSKKM